MYDNELKQIIADSCEKIGIIGPDTVNRITEAGGRLFTINQAGYVEPCGDFATVAEFVRSFMAKDQRQGIPLKERLLGQLIEMASKGDMIGYRRVRAEYSKA